MTLLIQGKYYQADLSRKRGGNSKTKSDGFGGGAVIPFPTFYFVREAVPEEWRLPSLSVSLQ